MDCHKTQIELAGGPDLSAEARQHLEGCADCKLFAGDLRELRLLTESPLATPPELKERTLETCQSMLAAKGAARGKSFWHRLGGRIDSPQFVAAAAIFGLAILAALTSYQFSDLQDENTSMFMKISITQILIQNLVAALFLPALLLLKNRLWSGRSYAAHSGE
jgi:hypothetical protein